MRVGIDIGRVLMCPTQDDGSPDTSFLSATPEAALTTPAAAHAFSVIRELSAKLSGRVWLVSKAGPRIQGLTLEWLRYSAFYEQTGVAPTHVRFCRKRPEKRNIAIELRLTHFVDDRLDVLQHLRGVVPHLYLFGVQSGAPPDWVRPTLDWLAVAQELGVAFGRTQVDGRNTLGQPHPVR